MRTAGRAQQMLCRSGFHRRRLPPERNLAYSAPALSLICCRKLGRGTSVGWRRSCAALCSARYRF